jgi:hypothetical protein
MMIYILSIILAASGSFPAAQQETTNTVEQPSIENVMAFSNRAEESLTSWLGTVSPLVEAYFQQCLVVDDITCRLNSDRYLLMRFDGTAGARKGSLLRDQGLAGRGETVQPADTQRLLDGLVHTMTPDWKQLVPGQYQYTFIKATLLGALHCVVYDVKPLSSDGGFTGRLYLETRTWNIVRYTGSSSQVDEMLSALRAKKSKFRLDAWRMNISKDRWAPAYVYLQEDAPLGVRADSIVRGHVRFWGYEQASTAVRETRGEVFLNDSSSTSQNRTRSWAGPPQTQRLFEKQAEENVFARLKYGWFVGPTGEVEKMVDQVLTNLVLTNNIVGEPMHCLVLATGPIEAFLVGNKIVVSRELVNVVPSESALAMVLAHMLAHSILGHRKVDPRLAFPDILRISDAELLANLHFRHSGAEEKAADEKAMEILANSPYKGSMQDAGLFMQAIQTYRDRLTGLITPTFGEDLADLSHAVRNHITTRTTQLLDEKSVDQVAAKSLGSRLQMDPFSGRLTFFHQELPIAPVLYERQSLGITPFVPFLDYFAPKVTAPAPTTPTKAPAHPHNGQPSNRPATSAKKGPA